MKAGLLGGRSKGYLWLEAALFEAALFESGSKVVYGQK